MDNSNIQCLINTKVDNNLTSLNRMECIFETLEKIRKLKLPVTIVDGGSECQSFKSHLADFGKIATNFDIVFSEKYESYGEQIRESYKYCLENSGEKNKYIFRFEPEKTGLFTKNNLKIIAESLQLHQGDFEYISFSRKQAINMPKSQLDSENRFSKQINTELEKLGIDFSNFYMGSEGLCEGPASLFGPLLATHEGVERIMSSVSNTVRDGNEILISNTIKALFEGQFGAGKGVIGEALDFRYNKTLEYLPEEQELEKIRQMKQLGEPFYFEEYKLNNPHSLVVKRYETYIYIREAISKVIQQL